jgi:hypothetical protein
MFADGNENKETVLLDEPYIVPDTRENRKPIENGDEIRYLIYMKP